MVGDAHISNNQDLTRFDALGNFILDKRPNYLILMGDFLTLNCLSAWDKDKRKLMEGRRYSLEIDAGNEALDKILGPINKYNNSLKRNKQKLIYIKKVYIEGNHSFRISRYLEKDPTFDGQVGIIKDLRLNERDFEWVPYGDYFYVNGIGLTHVPFSGAGPISGMNLCRKASMLSVKSVVFGHCFSDDTEILTIDGWKNKNQLVENETLIATLNLEKDQIEYQEIIKKYEYNNYNNLIHFKSKMVLDHFVTKDHGMITLRKNSYYKCSAEELLKKKLTKILVAGHVSNNKDSLIYNDNELKLLVQLITDGSMDRDKYWRFHLKKSRKITRLCSLLDEMEIKYTYSTNNKTTRIYIGRLPEKFNSKLIPTNFRFLNERQIKIVLEEWAVTDGIKYSTTSSQLSTNIKHNADMLQELCVLNGHKCNMTVQHKLNYKVTYALAIRFDHNIINTTINKHSKIISNNKNVFCLSVPNGTLIIRRNGRVIITQNSHEFSIEHYQKIGMEQLQSILNCGCFFEHNEEWTHGLSTNYWKGIMLLHNYDDMRFDIETYSMDRLKSLYL